MPLQNHSSYRPLATDHHSLTPRTPHSRSNSVRFEGAFDISDSDNPHAFTDWQTIPLLGDDDLEEAKDYRNLNVFFRRIILAVVSVTLSLILLALVKAAATRETLAAFYVSLTEPIGGNTVEHAGMPVESYDYKLISYQNYTHFPLTPSEYRAECTKTMSSPMAHFAYWGDGGVDVLHPETNTEVGQEPPPCRSTITYMLGQEVGLLADLALMAQAAGLASERNRTFFIDDTYWNRGKWSDYFEDVHDLLPGPEPGCSAPPPEELVACPRTAKHWVINSQTSQFHFGHSFSEAYEDPHAMSINRLKPIYKRAQNSFNELFRPRADLADLIQKARLEFASTFAQPGTSEYVSVHVRRGDRMGTSRKHHNSRLPIELYAKAVETTWTRLNLTSSNSDQLVIYFASDSPSAPENIISYLPPGSRIYSLARSVWTDLKELASPQPYIQPSFDKLAKDDRIRLTKGMLVDFALLSGLWGGNRVGLTPAATICGHSSSVCKMSALGFGWDRAFGDLEGGIDREGMRWVAIDNAGAILPLWEPFEIFY